ncbi:hypothetical protein BRC91_08225 [Halobacteriales archaeon QS_4_62_28]|nr:MAG: hypothetical protein BRC91_08225 [Halobacteriales archaeon QS_4_62_28]
MMCIQAGDALSSGDYSFAVESNPGSRLVVNGSEVINSPYGPAEDSGTVTLENGTNQLRLEYADIEGEHFLGVGWRDSHDQLLPRISVVDPLRSGDSFEYEIEVPARAVAKRSAMPFASNRSLAIGLPPNTNCCFDTTTGAVQYGWRGGFLDYGPQVAYGDGRGNDASELLGTRFQAGADEYPLRFGTDAIEPDYQFDGYREGFDTVDLFYRVDGCDVVQTIKRSQDGVGLTYTFSLKDPPAGTIYFITDTGSDIERSASVGTWNGGTLEVPAGTSTFAVTMRSGGALE